MVAAMFNLDLTAVSALCSVPRCTAAVIVPHSGNSSQGAAVIVVNSAAHSAVRGLLRPLPPSPHSICSFLPGPGPAPADGGTAGAKYELWLCCLCSV